MNKKLFLSIFVTIIFIIIGSYQWRSHHQIELANNIFDPEERGLTGRYVPWPVGPYIIGSLTGNEVERVRELNSANLEDGAMYKENLKLIIFLSDGHFILHFEQ